MNQQARFAVITKVKVKPESIDLLAKLFAETNPTLVEKEIDWVEAKFTANRAANEITVLAFWINDKSYLQFSSSETFRNTMQQFVSHFTEAPRVQINEILVEMNHKKLWQAN